ncbi:MAG: rRNA pseudouridine synthase [Firmicutes bacterium]|nr:rRNA pseudouridine synthase [Bacillota bacterium]
MERLQKVLAQAGIASRRRSEELILAGRVRVNGIIVNQLGMKVDWDRDVIEVDGRRLKKPVEPVYILLNKPVGYVTTVRDPQGRKKVTDLIRGVSERIYPVGRLDYDTEGLLLLTNDGELTYALTHPKHEVSKTYLAKVLGVPSPAKLRTLQRGVQLEDGKTAPARVRLLARIEGNALLEIQVHEGRNRQVRRMCEAIGHPVLELKRTQLAFLSLDGLRVGQYRHLTPAEVRKLKQLAGSGQKKSPRPDRKSPA